MPLPDLLTIGVELMLLGMGIVFGFLIILVGALKVMSAAAGRLAPVAAPEPPAVKGRPSGADETTIAVISAAVSRYRSSRRS